MKNYIHIRGARENNLKNIEVKIPHDKLVVITGPSGSGKSSLALDTLYAEGQRRYMESLSVYARQFLVRLPKPDCDSVVGIRPAIAIEQKSSTANPRSTVGTVTEIYDYLRLLYARIGEIFCHKCGEPVKQESVKDVVEAVSLLEHNTRFMISFPLNPAQTGEIDQLRAKGFRRIWTGHSLTSIDKFNGKNGWVVVDRLIHSEKMDRLRLVDSIETAFTAGDNSMDLIMEDGVIHHFSQALKCSKCGTAAIAPEPRFFSYNNAYGACPGCQGFGAMSCLDPERIIPNPALSLRQGAIAPWNSKMYQRYLMKLAYAAQQNGIDMDKPYRLLSHDVQKLVMEGGPGFTGVFGFFRRLERKKYKIQNRVLLARYRRYFTCTQCEGKRLRPEALAVRIQGKNISDLNRMNIGDLQLFFRNLHLRPEQNEIGMILLQEIAQRLRFLYEMGLHYLQLDRRTDSLSGGELQRINLASALGTALTGTLYVLDEPTVGLHPRDTGRLLRSLKSLVAAGNTTVVVEHDADVMKRSEYLIDLGPGSGENGGSLVYQGKTSSFLKQGRGLTADYLSGKIHPTVLRRTRTPSPGQWIEIRGARQHNLKNIDVRLPLKKLVCLTGVSGSGKSTLAEGILFRAFRNARGETTEQVGMHQDIAGLEQISEMELINQSPIGRSSRSNPITYIKGFDEIRRLFAETALARGRGYKPGHFSFNVSGGRCDSCQGEGRQKIEMQFMADIFLECEDCQGKRFKRTTLDIRYQGKNIAEILEMSVEEALQFFRKNHRITERLNLLKSVGLGYLRLGQPSTTLSGGEAQRLKLAAHLSKKKHGQTLFIFDEPTTGLHFNEISLLLQVFSELLQRGASLLVIEHNLEIIRNAEWIIDLGPEGGSGGGHIVAEGPPESIVAKPKSHTGRYLAPLLKK